MSRFKIFIINSFFGSVIFWGTFFILRLLFELTFEGSLLLFIIFPIALSVYFRFIPKDRSRLVAGSYLFGIWFFAPFYLLCPALIINGIPSNLFSGPINLITQLSPLGTLYISFVYGAGPALISCSALLLLKCFINQPKT